MVRIESLQEGADGVAKAKTPGGSLFRFRARYYALALELLDLADGGAPDGALPGAGDEAHGEALELAAKALEAEGRAASLLARAEQTRLGLIRKLVRHELPEAAAAMAVDFLAERGLQSDRRFAEAWIRQRARRRAEGPRTLAAGLAARLVDRDAARGALADALDGAGRLELAEAAYAQLERRRSGERELRDAFLALGWKPSDQREVLDSRRIDG